MSNPSCTWPSLSMRSFTPASRTKSTKPCSRMPARILPNTYSPDTRSTIMLSIPCLANSCPSNRPEGPAPIMATCVFSVFIAHISCLSMQTSCLWQRTLVIHISSNLLYFLIMLSFCNGAASESGVNSVLSFIR